MDIAANEKIMRDKMYSSMGWINDEGYWRPKNKVYSKKEGNKIERIKGRRKDGNHTKQDRPCYVCKEVHPKTEMHRQEYKSTRICKRGMEDVKNIIYRCDKCHAKYKPKHEYTSDREIARNKK